MDSKTSHLDDVLLEKLELAFHKETSEIMFHEVAKIAKEHDPVDLAYAVTRLPAYARVVVYKNLPDIDAKIIFIINTGSSTRVAIFRQIDDVEIKELVEKMPADEAVWILDDVSDRRLKRVLDLLTPKKASRIKELQKHGRDSVGRLMTNEFFAFPMQATIKDVASQIRDNPGIELTRSIFVTTEDGRPIGYVPERSLIINNEKVPLHKIMRPILHSVEPDACRDEAVDLVERYKIPDVPVVDDTGRLVGVVTYEDIVEAMEDIADEIIATIAGTGEDVREHEPIVRRFFWRAPWLLVTLCVGVITSTFMSQFYDKIWFAFLPFFVPLITGMSGNVGIQCSTVLVRGMSTGELSYGSRREAIVKEILIGLMIGTAFGILSGCLIFLLYFLGLQHVGSHPVMIAFTIACGLFSACMMATTLGAFSPFFFARFRIDPAVAAGPIVTAFNDMLSTVTFFIVARSIYLVVIG